MGKLRDKIKNTFDSATQGAKDAAARAKAAAEKAAADAKKKAQDAQAKAEAARNKALAEAKKKADAINNKVADAMNKVKAKLLPKDAPFIALLPFKPIMQTALKQRNIANNGSLSDVSRKFYGGVVIPFYKKAPVVNVLSGASLIKHSFNADGDEATYTESGSTASQYEAGAKETKGMIEKIIAWFKERKAKKEAKKAAEAEAAATGAAVAANYGDLSTPPLTPEEEVIVDAVDDATKNIVDAAEKDATAEEGFSPLEIVLGLAGVVAFIVIVKKVFFSK